jgi:uncharacterized protein YdaU (DUF1376 family)
MSLAYFAFYPNDFIGATCHLNAEQTGAYIKILCFLWQKERSKESYLKAVGFGSVSVGLSEWEPVAELLQIDENGFFYNRRLEEEREKATKKHEAQVNNGKKGGRPRKEEPKPNPNQKVIESQVKPMANPQAKPIESNHNHNHNQLNNKRVLPENGVSKPQKKSLEKRKEDFKEEIVGYHPKYEKELLNEFYSYWSEHGNDDTKMRKEKEKSFSVNRRLGTWKKNQKDFKPNGQKKERVINWGIGI